MDGSASLVSNLFCDNVYIINHNIKRQIVQKIKVSNALFASTGRERSTTRDMNEKITKFSIFSDRFEILPKCPEQKQHLRRKFCFILTCTQLESDCMDTVQ